MEFLPPAFEGLKNVKQFIVCKIVPSATRPGKTDKLPIDPVTGVLLNAQDSRHWMMADEAIAWHLSHGYTVGFVFTQNDPYFFLDIDGCLMPSGEWSIVANSLCTSLAGAAVEISSSGRGLHIFGRAESIPHACKYKGTNADLELYTSGRFVAMTGTGVIGNIDTDHTSALHEIIAEYFPVSSDSDTPWNWSSEPVPEWSGPMNDSVLLDRMLKSHSPAAYFGGKASFKDLWEADETVLSKAYPDQYAERAYDGSSADAALASHLAFWTGNNCERMQALMMQSQLKREKWAREDYLRRTILNACANKKEWLNDKKLGPPRVESPETPNATTGKRYEGATILSVDQQLELFKGCVYVQDEHKILIPGGDLLKPDQFRAAYGGFSFIMDNSNSRVSRNAWECFTESQSIRFPKAMSTCFKPDREPTELINEGDRVYVNIWWPNKIKRQKGDPSLFLEHIKKLIPNERDAEIFLSYLAALIQYPGIKFQWAPVLQGVDGNGKSFFTVGMQKIIGTKYSHSPAASELTEKFNDWLYKKLFIAIEDIYTPGTKEKDEIIEFMKPIITQTNREIRSMQQNKLMRDICCNFIINTNHKDGIRKNKNDRRFAPFFTAQQEDNHLPRDGLTQEYFAKLYNWADCKNGWAIIADYLLDYKIRDEYNPSHKNISPITSSTEEAIKEGFGRVEQEIMEAIEQEISGFRGGWISSSALDKLLTHLSLAARIPINKRRALLKSLGYDYHPALNDGRVNNIVLPDGNKPKLFIKSDHPARKITNPAEVARLYSVAQTAGA